MANIAKLLVGESFVGDGDEVLQIDSRVGPWESAVETTFVTAFTSTKEGLATRLAVLEPNLLAKHNTVLFNKGVINGARQAVQMLGLV